MLHDFWINFRNKYITDEGVRMMNRHILWWLKLKLWLSKVVSPKRVLVVLAGLVATSCFVYIAYIERGYFVIGGEYLLLPVLYLFYKVIKEVVKDVKNGI